MKLLKEIDLLLTKRIAERFASPALFRFAAFFAHSGDSWFWCLGLLIAWLFSSGDAHRTLAFWGLSIAGTAVLIFFVKRLIRRKRPEGEWGKIYRQGDPHSFPSGHAVRGGLILMLAWHTFGFPCVIGFLIWSILMILARVATRLHYVSDILAGYLIGIAIGVILILLQPWFYQTFPFLFNFSFYE